MTLKIKKILISQPQPQTEKSPYYDIEKEYGVECVFRPFFKVEGLSAKEFRQQKINLLDYTAVVFTSRHAVDNYFNLAKEMRITIPEDIDFQHCFDDILKQYTISHKIQRVKTSDFGALFEIIYCICLKNDVDQKAFIDKLRCRNGNLSIVLNTEIIDEKVYI